MARLHETLRRASRPTLAVVDSPAATARWPSAVASPNSQPSQSPGAASASSLGSHAGLAGAAGVSGSSLQPGMQHAQHVEHVPHAQQGQREQERRRSPGRGEPRLRRSVEEQLAELRARRRAAEAAEAEMQVFGGSLYVTEL
jgi:hypothetical protein